MPDSTSELERAVADIPLTRSAREILDRAVAAAKARGTSPTARDILEATLSTRGTLAEQAMRALGADPAAIASQLSPADSDVATVPLRQLLVNANREAQVLGHYHVDSIHLLLAMLYSDSPATSTPLQKAGLTMYDLRRHLQAGTKADFQPGESDRASATRSQPAPAAGRARNQGPAFGGPCESGRFAAAEAVALAARRDQDQPGLPRSRRRHRGSGSIAVGGNPPRVCRTPDDPFRHRRLDHLGVRA